MFLKRMKIMVLSFAICLSFFIVSGHHTSQAMDYGTQRSYHVGEVMWTMHYVLGGLFPTGLDDDGVTRVPQNYWIGVEEVTYELWYMVREWAEKEGYSFFNKGMEGSVRGGGDYPEYYNIGRYPTSSRREPVTMINWYDSIIWCNALSEYLGFDPVYRYEDQVLREALMIHHGDRVTLESGDGFRLPGSDEWELAARFIGPERPLGEGLSSAALFVEGVYFTPGNYASGAKSPAWSGHWLMGDQGDMEATREAAWYHLDYGGNTTKSQDVGQKPPLGNGLGLFDMSGNVWEWCYDWHPDHIGWDRVLRGGSWEDLPSFLQVGFVGLQNPLDRSHNVGFRLVRSDL